MTAVTLREAAEILGYAPYTLSTYQQRHADWPAPVGRRGNARLYDLDEIRAHLGHDDTELRSQRAERHDDGTAITCLECGARLRSLAQHLQARHQLTAADYRDRHNLPRTTALQSRATRAAHARTMTEDRRALLRHDEQAARSQRSREHTRTAHQRAGVPEQRAPGQAKGVAAMHATRRTQLDERMRDLGYDDLEHAIRATADLTQVAAAKALHASRGAIARWRPRVLGE